jgi:hypothetical protein
MTSPTAAGMLEALHQSGARIPGGCDDCNAEQTIQRFAAGVYRLVVEHDQSCPWFAAYQQRRRP